MDGLVPDGYVELAVVPLCVFWSSTDSGRTANGRLLYCAGSGAQITVAITHLRKSYGRVTALDEISFPSPEARNFGIIGPSQHGVDCKRPAVARPTLEIVGTELP